jgi:hypothetical protein
MLEGKAGCIHHSAIDARIRFCCEMAGNININAVQNRLEVANEPDKLRTEIELAKEQKAIGRDDAVGAEFHVLQAAEESRKDAPDRANFLGHMKKAKAVIGNGVALAGLATAVLKAIELGQKHF